MGYQKMKYVGSPETRAGGGIPKRGAIWKEINFSAITKVERVLWLGN